MIGDLSGTGAISTVGILVPARDEQQRIAACLRAIRTALAVVPDEITVGVCLIVDRCRDSTEEVARSVLGERPWPGVQLIRNRRRVTIGELRAQGMRRLLAAIGPDRGRRTWLLSTDADSVVPPSWVLDHLRYADTGVDAVAGTVTLDESEHLDRAALSRYTEIVDEGIRGGIHTHVYAANLGIRASAYLDVGGFPAEASGEEHSLLASLQAAGHTVAQSTDLSVRTSARTEGRTGAGLAELLSTLHDRHTTADERSSRASGRQELS